MWGCGGVAGWGWGGGGGRADLGVLKKERDELTRTKNRGRAEKERGIMGEVSKKKKTRRKGNRTKRLPEKAHREKPKMNEKGWKLERKQRGN